jgi:hypothetical protein
VFLLQMQLVCSHIFTGTEFSIETALSDQYFVCFVLWFSHFYLCLYSC